jgi:hypothetical protein
VRFFFIPRPAKNPFVYVLLPLKFAAQIIGGFNHIYFGIVILSPGIKFGKEQRFLMRLHHIFSDLGFNVVDILLDLLLVFAFADENNVLVLNHNIILQPLQNHQHMILHIHYIS